MAYDLGEIRQALSAAEERYGLPSGTLHQTAWNESRFRPEIISGEQRSPKGAVGLMQFMPATARQYGIDPTDPFESIDAAGQYWRESLNRRQGNMRLAAADYNWGPGRVNAWLRGDASPPEETRKYMATYEETAPAPVAPAAPAPVAPAAPPLDSISEQLFERLMSPPPPEPEPPWWVQSLGMIGQGGLSAVAPEYAQQLMLARQQEMMAARERRRERRQATLEALKLRLMMRQPQAVRDPRPASIQAHEYYRSLPPEERELWREREMLNQPTPYSYVTTPSGEVLRAPTRGSGLPETIREGTSVSERREEAQTTQIEAGKIDEALEQLQPTRDRVFGLRDELRKTRVLLRAIDDLNVAGVTDYPWLQFQHPEIANQLQAMFTQAGLDRLDQLKGAASDRDIELVMRGNPNLWLPGAGGEKAVRDNLAARVRGLERLIQKYGADMNRYEEMVREPATPWSIEPSDEELGLEPPSPGE